MMIPKIPKFTQLQSLEMYSVLEEIHSALEVKKDNKGGLNKIFQYEIGWFVGIGELLDKIKNQASDPVINTAVERLK